MQSREETCPICKKEFSWQTKTGPWHPGPLGLLRNEGHFHPHCLHLLCCRAHDCCYKKLKEIGCQPVLNSYPFHIVNSTVVCGCALGGNCLCGLKACECDKQSVYCFKQSLPTYEKNFKQFFSSRPQCGRRKLRC
ncbi:putative inactive group IIC secretory phospholipase A2 isoform X3 [Castor canadensis]|uniref:Inactive group IIC secretory phospholipase A2 isoform X3 n=1 Tax=Castor canadensis TaxID=51338 RepID=A0AC58N6F7_CASCN